MREIPPYRKFRCVPPEKIDRELVVYTSDVTRMQLLMSVIGGGCGGRISVHALLRTRIPTENGLQPTKHREMEKPD